VPCICHVMAASNVPVCNNEQGVHTSRHGWCCLLLVLAKTGLDQLHC
jgi:hypothetical protein